ncbi:uncharacterized protein LOC117577871 [Drosophila albomicans]|uniref:Uncharacterized protein LOC117577871 n=1 Tax=Drosophila albomicans TaxID=7291 RepID=A0A6P8XZ81_DROAB|nr:uncharacterized protein LOC117577871 [Drosophila albomicans]
MSKRNKEGDELLRRKHARMRFKKLIRIALANTLWITEVDDGGFTLNVRKNVAMMVRKKHKTGILTMAQKGLLATAHHKRTIEERKKLCLIVAGLGSFAQVPPKIRARLVPHLRFMQIAAGRVLMKEGDVAICVYFVVSGDIEMSRKVWNKVTRKMESKPEVFCGPGDWIGEVELLEKGLRMDTYTAITNCEILVLDDVNFKTILMPYVKKVWLEKKKAIASLSYLRFMTEAQVVSACKFGMIRQYDPMSTIYPEEKDSINHVHFVLSGECVLLQCLHMKVNTVKGELQYELPEVLKDESENDAEDDKPEPFDVREILRSSSSLDELGYNKKKAKRKAEFSKIEAHCKFLNQKPKPVEEEPPAMPHRRHYAKSIANAEVADVRKSSYRVIDQFEDFYGDFSEDEYDGFRISGSMINRYYSSSLVNQLAEGREAAISFMGHKSSKSNQMMLEEVESEESEIFTATTRSETTASTKSLSIRASKDDNYATHFIDIGSMYFGGLCGVGETNDHRVLMARTTVQCLLIPRYWLMEDEQNPGHIWQRMRFYLDRCIPSRKTLFRDFIKSRKWSNFKDDCVEPFTHSTTNPTKIEDIPIFIRIVKSKESPTHDH